MPAPTTAPGSSKRRKSDRQTVLRIRSQPYRRTGHNLGQSHVTTVPNLTLKDGRRVQRGRQTVTFDHPAVQCIAGMQPTPGIIHLDHCQAVGLIGKQVFHKADRMYRTKEVAQPAEMRFRHRLGNILQQQTNHDSPRAPSAQSWFTFEAHGPLTGAGRSGIRLGQTLNQNTTQPLSPGPVTEN